MSWRARAFLLVLASRHVLVGFFLLAAPERFTSSSFTVIRDVLPLPAWGMLLVLTGSQAVGATVAASEKWARLVLIASAGLTAAWCAGFTATGFQGTLDAPQLPIVWAALTSKDLILSAMPLRTPLEDMARRRGLLE